MIRRVIQEIFVWYIFLGDWQNKQIKLLNWKTIFILNIIDSLGLPISIDNIKATIVLMQFQTLVETL